MKSLLVISILLTTFLEVKSSEIKDIFFNVYRNGSKIGYHKIDFNNNDNNSVNPFVEIKFEVTFLGFTVYNYFHQNNENWLNNSLVELKSKTDKDGENLFCNAKKINNGISLDGTNNKEKTNNMILPTSYWNYDLVKDKKDKTVLNTQDCSFIDFKINYLGEDSIYNNEMLAEHFKLTGKEITGDDVDIDIWYKDSQWVKMIFYKDGSEIEYFLKDLITMNKKTVWLTGGGTGIGKDLTKILCDNGFDVIISGRRKDKLIEVAKYNKKKIFPYKLDVSNLKETDIVAKKIIKKFKFIDLLVLNACNL